MIFNFVPGTDLHRTSASFCTERPMHREVMWWYRRGSTAFLSWLCDGWGAAGGPPEHLRILLEGESLLNDACSITLFTIFIHFVTSAARGHPSTEPIPEIIAIVLKQTAWLTLGVLPDPLAVQLFSFHYPHQPQ